MIIGLYSFKGGSGKTFVATNLAYILSGRGKSVCLIELDMRAPSLHWYFEGEKFINELLSGKERAENYIRMIRKNLGVIMANPSPDEIRKDLTRHVMLRA